MKRHAFLYLLLCLPWAGMAQEAGLAMPEALSERLFACLPEKR